MLGTLDRDVKGIEIVRYVAPVILIKPTTKDGKQIKGFKTTVKYTKSGSIERRWYTSRAGVVKPKPSRMSKATVAIARRSSCPTAR